MPIKFELCEDRQLLEQYYRLRERCFRQDLGIPDFDGSEDELDRRGHILIALDGDRCVGGARITPGAPGLQQLDYQEVVTEACCMWERFVVDPEVRAVSLVRDFCAELIAQSRTFGYHSALVLSSLCNARFYRRCHFALGVDFQIKQQVPDLAKGAFEGLEHYLSISYLNPANSLRIAA